MSTYKPQETWYCDWYLWCKTDQPDWITENSILLYINPNARILKIDSTEDLQCVLEEYPYVKFGKWQSFRLYPNYKLIRKDYDIVWLTDRGQADTRNSTNYRGGVDLYGWDCESSLMLNNVVAKFKYFKILPPKEEQEYYEKYVNV